MPLLIPDAGELKLLTDLLSAGENWSLGLFTSNITPAESDVAATYTAAEAAGAWYARKTLTRSISGSTWATTASGAPSGSWSAESAVAKSSYNAASPQSWTVSGAGATVYGYFVLGATSGTLLFAEKFAASRILQVGDTLNVTPTFEFA